jgi:hypothetical protein
VPCAVQSASGDGAVGWVQRSVSDGSGSVGCVVECRRVGLLLLRRARRYYRGLCSALATGGLGANGGESAVPCDGCSTCGDGAVKAFGVVAFASARNSVSGGLRDGGGAFDASSSVGGSDTCCCGALGAAREAGGLGANGGESDMPCGFGSIVGDGAVETVGVVVVGSAQLSVSDGSDGGVGAFDGSSRVVGSGSCFGGAARGASDLGANDD